MNYQHIKYKQDQKICLSGTPCSNLFVVYSGFLKTSWSDAYGNEKVLGFPMRGEILGLDGLNDYEYKNDVVAISDVELIIIPNKINNIHDPEDSHLVNKLLNIFSKELVAESLVNSFVLQDQPHFFAPLNLKFHKYGSEVEAFEIYPKSLKEALIGEEEYTIWSSIEDDVLIGMGAIVMDRAVIGRNSIVAAGAVVTKNVSDFALYAGVPAKQIGWMSKFGKRIELPLIGNAKYTCPYTGDIYELKGIKMILKY